MLKNFIKVTVRNFLRHAGYSLINIFGLAIGLACCILILLYIRNELSYDSFITKADRTFRVVSDGVIQGRNLRVANSPSVWTRYFNAEYPEIEKIVRLKPPDSHWIIKYENKVFAEKGFVFADSCLFDVFDYQIVKGNPHTALVGPNKIILTESTARKYFGDEDPVGKYLNADNTYNFQVSGIMQDPPKNSHFQFDFIASYATLESNPNIYGGLLENPMNFRIYTYILLRENTTREQFESKMDAFVQKYLAQIISNVGIEVHPHLQPVRDIHLHSNREYEMSPGGEILYIYIFGAIAVFVMIIACINFMNLATARSANRAKEVGLRKVVGAERGQLFRQFITESLVLSFLALILAVVFVQLLLPTFNTITEKSFTFADYTAPENLAIIVILTIIVGFLSGSYPAVLLSGLKPVNTLKGAIKAGAKSGGLRKALVIIQFTISVILIIGTLIINAQLNYMRNIDLGFNKKNIIHIPMSDPNMRRVYHSYKNRLLENPMITGVTAGSNGPVYGPYGIALIRTQDMPQDETVDSRIFLTDFDFVETLQFEMVTGRPLKREFTTDSLAILLNETAAKKLNITDITAKEIPFGRDRNMKIVGIVKDFHIQSLYNTIEPVVMIITNEQAYSHIFIRYKPEDQARVLEFLRSSWSEFFPDYPFLYSFMEDDFENLHRGIINMQTLIGYFTFLAIFVSCLGLFGLASFMSAQRTKEIGVRKVMGATTTSLTFLLLREFTLFTLLANVIAWPVGWYVMNKWLENFAYRTDIGVMTFVLASVIAFAIAIITVSYQTVKAALYNPVDALRYE